jgi:hypothetical protein
MESRDKGPFDKLMAGKAGSGEFIEPAPVSLSNRKGQGNKPPLKIILSSPAYFFAWNRLESGGIALDFIRGCLIVKLFAAIGAAMENDARNGVRLAVDGALDVSSHLADAWAAAHRTTFYADGGHKLFRSFAGDQYIIGIYTGAGNQFTLGVNHNTAEAPTMNDMQMLPTRLRM